MRASLYILCYTLLFFLFSIVINAQPCVPNSIALSSQAQVDSFSLIYPGCSIIEGALSINDNLSGDINSLIGLSQIKIINGDLVIKDNPALGSLFGLDSLKTVRGSLQIRNNDQITDFEGLGSLDSIITYNSFYTIALNIRDNALLENFNGINSLSVFGKIHPSSGSSYGGLIYIKDNPSLENIQDLNSLITNSVYIFEIENNLTLESLSGLEWLNSVSSLRIINNDALINLSGLDSLSNVGVFLNIFDNNNLNTLIGLGALNVINSIQIINNSALVSLEGLENLTELYGLQAMLNISSNINLLDLEGLNNLSSLSTAGSVDGFLKINNNPKLTDLSALISLQNIDGFLEIKNNATLASLYGLDSINASTVSQITIKDNPLLSTCDIESVCSYLSHSCNNAIIENNATGCYNRTEVELLCGYQPSIDILTQPVSQSAQVCDQVSFTIDVAGAGPFTYSWEKNGIAIPGANQNYFTTPILTTSDNLSTYNCIITDCSNSHSISSNTVLLNVYPPCTYDFPSIVLNKSSVSPGEVITITGSNFTSYGEIDVSIIDEGGLNVLQGIPTTTTGPGIFEIDLTITSTFLTGEYTINAIDVSTGNSAPVKIFYVNNFTQPGINIISPDMSSSYSLGTRFDVIWTDYVEGSDVVGQTGLIYKDYKIEISHNSGATWFFAFETYGEEAKANQVHTFILHDYFTFNTGTYNLRITDLDDPTDVVVSEPFQITGFSPNGFTTSLEWDVTVPHHIKSVESHPIGLAADGTARIFIKLKKSDNNEKYVSTIDATIQSPDYSSPQLIGRIMYATNHSTYSTEAKYAYLTDITYTATSNPNAEEYWFWLVAPDDFTDEISTESGEREIMVEFTINYTDGSSEVIQLYEPIKIVRPALFLVHGLGGDDDTFLHTKYSRTSEGSPYFNSSNEWKVIRRINIFPYTSLEVNMKLILERIGDENYQYDNSIKSVLREMHLLGYANKRVDYVAHSMGGLIGRTAIDNGGVWYNPGIGNLKNYGRGYINKFITICSPHNGSYLADFVLDRYNYSPYLLTIAGISTVYDNNNSWYFINGSPSPAVYNLQSGINGFKFGNTVVKNHLIGSDIDPMDTYSDNFLITNIRDIGLQFLYVFLRPPFTSIHDYFYNHYSSEDFLSETDMVVQVSSQLAGAVPMNAVNISFSTTDIGNKSMIYGLENQHIGIAENEKIGDRLKVLLNAKIGSGFFSDIIAGSPNTQNNLGTTPIISLATSVIDSSVTYFDTSHVEIIYPIDSSVILVDSLTDIKIQIKDTSNILRISLFFQLKNFQSYSHDSIQIFESSVSPDPLGKQTIVAIAEYDSLGFTIYQVDTLSVYVSTLDTLDGFYVKPEAVNLNPQQIFLPEYHAVYDNFIGYPQLSSDSLTYMIIDTNVVVYDSVGLRFIAKDTGTTHIIFNYEGYSDTTFIYISTPILSSEQIICPHENLLLFAGIIDSTKTYQWQLDSLNGFENIVDDTIYSGTDSAYLTINGFLPKWYNHQYRCIISDSLGATSSDIYTVKFVLEWNGSQDRDWNNSNNWDCDEIPSVYTDVLIPSSATQFPRVSSFAYCRSIDIENGASLDVDSLFKLCVKSELSYKCPEDILVNVDTGVTSVIVNYSIDTGDQCGGTPIQTTGLSSGSSFPVGITNNCFKFVDEQGVIIKTCCFDVIVIED